MATETDPIAAAKLRVVVATVTPSPVLVSALLFVDVGTLMVLRNDE